MRVALKIGVIALLGISGKAVAQPASSLADCVPAAILSGEDAVVSDLREQLQILGVSSIADSRCAVVMAEVALGPEGYAVVVTEPSGRTAKRTLSEVRIAATWIDSWLHNDIGASLLAARSLSNLPAATAPVVARHEQPVTSIAKPNRWQLGISYETATSGTGWRSLRADTCLAVGPVCLGLQGRLAVADSVAMNDGLSRGSQWDGDGLVAVTVPLKLGATTIEPRVAVGASAVTTERSEAQVDNPELFFGSLPSKRLTIGMRAEIGVSAVIPLAKFVELQLGASIDTRAFGSPKLVEDGLLEECPDGQINDPDCVVPPGALLVSLPADPTSLLRLAIGLRVEL